MLELLKTWWCKKCHFYLRMRYDENSREDIVMCICGKWYVSPRSSPKQWYQIDETAVREITALWQRMDQLLDEISLYLRRSGNQRA